MFDKIALLGAAALAAAAGYATDVFGGSEAETVEGRIYHYVRSNQDGSSAKDVYVYRAAHNQLEVYTATERCADATFVTAWVDSRTGRAAVMSGGQLMPNARHENFGSLAYDGAAQMLRAEFAMPDRQLRGQARVEEPVFHLYSFDLATLSVQTMALENRRADFSFGLPTIAIAPGADEPVSHLGRADAVFAGEEDYHGTAALRFEVGGPALGENGGPLWIDAESGHVLGAEWGIPAHAGMDDFALRLVETEDGGDAGWETLLTNHFEGCPTV